MRAKDKRRHPTGQERERGVRVRPMRPDETQRVAEITLACPEAAQWSAEDYAAFLVREVPWDGRGGAALVAETAEGVVGFAAVRVVEDELEILNLGVSFKERRRGVGRALLTAVFESAKKAGATAAYCEVRESNRGALAFYAKHGFRGSGRRLRYYANPVEDALVLMRPL